MHLEVEMFKITRFKLTSIFFIVIQYKPNFARGKKSKITKIKNSFVIKERKKKN